MPPTSPRQPVSRLLSPDGRLQVQFQKPIPVGFFYLMPKKRLNIGLIGYLFMGKAHSNGWRQAPRFFDMKHDVRLHTICGRNAAAVKKAGKQYGWDHTATDWREVVANPDIDVIDINTPNDSHAEIAIAAAKAGKHILCEKPLAMDVKQCRQMLQAVKKAKVVHMICHNYRRIPAIAQAKKMIDEGALGQVRHYHARYAQSWLVDPKAPRLWRMQKQYAGSGAHGDINAHIIDLGRYLVGEFDEVSGQMHTFIKQRPLPDNPKKLGRVSVDDAAQCIGRFKNGALANLEATRYATGRKNRIHIEINGADGSLEFNLEDLNRLKYFDNTIPEDRQGFADIIVTQQKGVHPYVGQWWPPGHIIGYEHTFVHTIADFVNAVAKGKSVQPTFEDGLKNQQVLEAVEKSAETRRWVKV